MKFVEHRENSNCLSLENIPQTFIYFLTLEGEVVYVGQTTKGMSRILSHKDKIFDNAYIIPCEDFELDELESKYIRKYLPKYNKVLGAKDYTLAQALKEVNLFYGIITPEDADPEIDKYTFVKKYSMSQFKKMLKIAGIIPISFNYKLYITSQDMSVLSDYILYERMGYEGYEDFSLGV